MPGEPKLRTRFAIKSGFGITLVRLKNLCGVDAMFDEKSAELETDGKSAELIRP